MWQWAEATQESDPSRALAMFDAFLQEEPDSAETYVRIGIIHSKRNDFARALVAFEKAYALKPESEHARKNLFVAYYRHGVELDKMKRHGDAIALFNKALTLDSEYLDLYRVLGLAHRNAGNREESARAFAEILRRDERDEWALEAIINLSMGAGNRAYQERDFKRAIDEFERIPESARPPAVHGVLGYLYLEFNQYGKAVDSLGRMLLHDPSDKASQQNLEFAQSRIKNELKRDMTQAEVDPLRWALYRSDIYLLTARITRRVRKNDLTEFAKLLAAAPLDPHTVRAAQDCALAIVRAAPNEGAPIATAAFKLHPDHPGLMEWRNTQ